MILYSMAVNRRVASSTLARGAKLFNQSGSYHSQYSCLSVPVAK
jgi:hypothetical protein